MANSRLEEAKLGGIGAELLCDYEARSIVFVLVHGQGLGGKKLSNLSLDGY